MLPGLMQDAPLQISAILTHAARAHGAREIVSKLAGEPTWRYDWAGCEIRSRRAAQMLGTLGIESGDRVSSLAWNTHRHLELFYAVPGIGAVLHTANPRLSDDQIAFTINHAGSRILFFDANLAELVERLKPLLPAIEHFVLLAAPYEELVAAEDGNFDWPRFDENAAAFLCYTSGTTGDPKGVLYSHRSIVLHGMAAGLSSAFGFSAFDTIMPCSSMYHATAWGLPFTAAINGCKLVLPCDKMDGASLAELILGEGVTFSGGVPTIWTMYLAHLETSGKGVGHLKRLVIGGSAVPRAMAETFRERYGVTVLQIWGMTETNPLGVIATPTPLLMAEGEDFANETILTRQGRMQFGIELRIIDDEGAPLAWDGEQAGKLQVRGPWVVDRYYPDLPAAAGDGWFDTGDIGTIDRFGFLRLTDRAKDVIKSGGEWISSIDLENAAVGCPGVRIAAVIGVQHPKWEERPLLVIETHEGETVAADAIRTHLETRVVRWWMPDDILFDTVPLTATGKIDKKALRDRYRDHLANG
ncbi:fatty-acyl-CoA synthase [Sphingopyxis sp. YR583]|uniref:long-chain fatty acid--CoA ligase n=1 Tax=Sphingopyxis sp. YR583 TaxID=1881047 RepID=UPI0008A8013C|nr:long-chain fatty acid--CoA ligase [Sphingopyxis sp. YR583]SEH19673.1 fatty-acyl-CoA synthase [Sphingopyxis sp. YR583]